MTVTGLTYNPALPDPAVLDIDGPEFYAGGWARTLDDQPIRHRAGCLLAHTAPAPVCACQPPL